MCCFYPPGNTNFAKPLHYTAALPGWSAAGMLVLGLGLVFDFLVLGLASLRARTRLRTCKNVKAYKRLKSS